MATVAKRKTLPTVLAIRDSAERARVLSRVYWPIVYRSLRSHAPDVTERRRVTMASAMVVHLGAESGFSGLVYNHNAGNITPGSSWKGDVFISQDSAPQYDGAGKYTGNTPFTQPFRSYGSLAEGVSDYVGFVKHHAPRAWATLHHGDPTDYFVALRCLNPPKCTLQYLGGHGETDAQLRAAMAINFAHVDAATKSLQPSPTKRALGISLVTFPIAAALTMTLVS